MTKEPGPGHRASAWRAHSTVWILIAITILVIAGAAWYFLAPLKVAKFQATLQARAISFALGKWTESSGIFNSDSGRVNVILLSGVAIRFDESDPVKCSSDSSLQQVKLVSVSVLPTQRVALEVQNTGLLRYSLESSDKPLIPSLTVQVSPQSNIQHVVCDANSRFAPKPGEWTIVARDPADPLEFLVDFAPPHPDKAPSSLANSAGPEPERDIPLLEGSTLRVQAGPDAAGPGNQLTILDTGKQVKPADGLTLEGLHNASIQSLSYDPAARALRIVSRGVTDSIEVRTGDEKSVETHSRFPRQVAGHVKEVLTAAVAFLTAVASLVGSILSIRSQWLQRREKLEASHSDQ